jgi:hypothetical protein
MKKLMSVLMAVCFINLIATAGPEEHPNKYCAKMKDGKVEVMHMGMAITAEAKLSNGSSIQPDGTIMKSDGSKSMLRAGQCLSEEGKVEMENQKSGNKSKSK